MSIKTEIITTKIDLELKNSFISIAKSKDRPASQILRDLIRLYVENNKIPSDETLITFQKTDLNQEVFHAKDAADLFKQLDI
jgi:antitoxin component of RelBE/YafQ-DinJ toxin-antitoxin module